MSTKTSKPYGSSPTSVSTMSLTGGMLVVVILGRLMVPALRRSAASAWHCGVLVTISLAKSSNVRGLVPRGL